MDLSYKLACYAYDVAGDWEAMAVKIKNNEDVFCYEIKEKYVTIADSEYPQTLRQLRYPPWVLFYEGDIALLNKRAISVVGSRNITAYGAWCTEKICQRLGKKYVLVSGLAKGVDALVHQVGIEIGKTIAVLGCGLSVCYPRDNEKLFKKMKQEQLVISEYPQNTSPQRHHFPWRNRIVAALGEKCIVTQARFHSGTMISVNYALELSKEVYCVPYPIGEKQGEGCNLLIQQGANLIVEVDNF
ncbi:MAG: DNA-processing protein DprA [Anaerorhabdus sp.]